MEYMLNKNGAHRQNNMDNTEHMKNVRMYRKFGDTWNMWKHIENMGNNETHEEHVCASCFPCCPHGLHFQFLSMFFHTFPYILCVPICFLYFEVSVRSHILSKTYQESGLWPATVHVRVSLAKGTGSLP